MKKLRLIQLKALAGFFLWAVIPGLGQAQTVVNCPASIQAAVDAAASGTTILVSGTCTESVFIRAEKKDITLDGQGTAILNGSSPTANVVRIDGGNITVTGFTINGGLYGVLVFAGGSATVDGNTIQNAGNDGVIITKLSTANIVDNLIRNNGRRGILVHQNSAVRVGVITTDDTVARPNTIQNNGDDGISLSQGAYGRIVGNQIINNTGDGILVTRGSQADISANDISGNVGRGIAVLQNSGAELGSDTGSGIFDQPNSTDVLNGGVGVQCSTNCYINGRLGTLNGSGGQLLVNSGGSNSLLLPDLVVTVGDSPDPAVAGSPLTYSITVTNNGTASASGVVLTDALPGSLTLVSATASQGSCAGTATVTCDLGTIGIGSSPTVSIVVTPTAVGETSNTVSVSENEPDLNTADNTATAVTTVNATPSPAIITTAASGLNFPFGVAVDNGNVYIADRNNHKVWKIGASPTDLILVAGTGEAGYNGDGINATTAQLNSPTSVALANGNLFITDSGSHIIRRVVLSSGIITTVAGIPQKNGLAVNGGPATEAELFGPRGVATDAAGNIYIADTMNQQIRKVDVTSGNILAVAGVAGETGNDDGPVASAKLNSPLGVAIYGSLIAIADEGNDSIRIVEEGSVSTLDAELDSPSGVAFDVNGNLYLADTDNHRIQRVSDGVVTTVAGTTDSSGYSGDGGAATAAKLDSPVAVAVDSTGRFLHIADLINNVIRKVDFIPDGGID